MGYEFNAYKILQISENATKEEVESAYQKLRAKYEDDRFLPGERGEEAAEKMQQLNVAYQEIMAKFMNEEHAHHSDFHDEEEVSSGDYQAIQQLIEDNKIDLALEKLDAITNRDAEWHFLQSVIFFKKNWYLESKKQLEFAVQKDPNNPRYTQALVKLTKIISSNTISPDQLRTTSEQAGANMHGNGTCTGSYCADCLLANACCNCARCGLGC